MAALLTIRDDRLEALPANWYAVDTETTLFRKEAYGWKDKTRIEPFGGHRLVLGSIAGAGSIWVHHRDSFLDSLQELLATGATLIFHHAAFDFFTILDARPSLAPALFAAVNENRIWDTKLFEMLIQIAQGSRLSRDFVLRAESLDKLALKYAGLTLNKGAERVTFAQFEDPTIHPSRDHLAYAAMDVLATYVVFAAQQTVATQLMDSFDGRNCAHAFARVRFGPLGLANQVKGSLAFAWLMRFPVRVDQDAAALRCADVSGSAGMLEEQLIGAKLAKRGPKSKRFSLSHKRLRDLLGGVATELGLKPEYSDTGLLSLNYDYWKTELTDWDESSERHAALLLWLKYTKARKLLNTYLYPYASSPVHYPCYWSIGARTTRTSCNHPNIQNVPKYKDGIRHLFVASPGNVLLEADLKAAELAGLAQVYYQLYGGSLLGDIINNNKDPHIEVARRIVGDIAWDQLQPADKKKFRQAAKAVNFGLPGGLGAKKFCKYMKRGYGVAFSETEAKQIRATALAVDPQLSRYLEDGEAEELMKRASKNLCLPLSQLITKLEAWEDESSRQPRWEVAYRRLFFWRRGSDEYTIPAPPGFNRETDLFRIAANTLSGSIRGNCLYTEAHNFPFQAAVADIAKVSLYNLCVLWHLQENPRWGPYAFVHDSIVVDTPPEELNDVKEKLEWSMNTALRAFLPNIPGAGVAFSEPSMWWGKATDASGNEVGS